MAFVLSTIFVAIYALGFSFLYSHVNPSPNQSATVALALAGTILTVLGLYAVHFLSSFLALFLTVAAISSEIDSGTLQPRATWEFSSPNRGTSGLRRPPSGALTSAVIRTRPPIWRRCECRLRPRSPQSGRGRVAAVRFSRSAPQPCWSQVRSSPLRRWSGYWVASPSGCVAGCSAGLPTWPRWWPFP